MGDQHLATYHYNGGIEIEVYGCWDKKTPDEQFDYYDLFLGEEHLNPGEIFSEWPTWEDARGFLP